VEEVDYRELVKRGVKLPPLRELQSGGLVGEADLVDCVSDSDDKWFEGPFGFVLVNAKVIPFVPCKGMLGFFEPKRG
jgi:hypothetical protein